MAPTLLVPSLRTLPEQIESLMLSSTTVPFQSILSWPYLSKSSLLTSDKITQAKVCGKKQLSEGNAIYLNASQGRDSPSNDSNFFTLPRLRLELSLSPNLTPSLTSVELPQMHGTLVTCLRAKELAAPLSTFECVKVDRALGPAGRFQKTLDHLPGHPMLKTYLKTHHDSLHASLDGRPHPEAMFRSSSSQFSCRAL